MKFEPAIEPLVGEDIPAGDYGMLEKWLIDGAFDLASKLLQMNSPAIERMYRDTLPEISGSGHGLDVTDILSIDSVARGYGVNYADDLYPALFVTGVDKIRATRPGNLYEATNKHPVYYIENNTLKVYPEPDIRDDQADESPEDRYNYIASILGDFALTSAFNTDGNGISGIPESYNNIISIYAAILYLGKLMGDVDLTLQDVVIPVKPSITAPSVVDVTWTYPDAPVPGSTSGLWSTISQVMSEISLPPGIVMPELDFEDAPVVVWDFPVLPVEPQIDWSGVTQTMDDIELPPNALVPQLDISDPDPIVWEFPSTPVQPTLDFADANNWINTEEDSEMLDSRIKEINARLQAYSTDVQAYSSEINALVTKNQGIVQTWGNEWSNRVQKYTAELNALVNKYRSESEGKQAIANAQVSIHNGQVQFVVSRAQAEINSYSSKVQAYQSDVQSIVAKNQGIIGVWSTEMQAKVQKYTSEIGALVNKYQAEIAGATQASSSQIAIRAEQLSEASKQVETILAEYTNSLQAHQIEVTKIIQENQSKIQERSQQVQIESAHNAQLIQEYSGELQGLQVQLADMQLDFQKKTTEYTWYQNRQIDLRNQYNQHLGLIQPKEGAKS